MAIDWKKAAHHYRKAALHHWTKLEYYKKQYKVEYIRSGELAKCLSARDTIKSVLQQVNRMVKEFQEDVRYGMDKKTAKKIRNGEMPGQKKLFEGNDE